MEIPPVEAKSMFTDFGPADCRSMAEAKLALAEGGGAARKVLLCDAAALLLLADHLDFIEIAVTAARKRRLH
jgi:hypothetical protein